EDGIRDPLVTGVQTCALPIFGKPLLAEAVVEPPLEAAQLALRYAVGRPSRVRLLRTLGGHEVRQILQADALAFVAMAGRAGEVRSEERRVGKECRSAGRT